jgi:NTE family protein
LQEAEMKDIVLALGGGGAKGNAHIGVIRVLEREGFNIRGIAGTSAGGLWGSLYAFGYTPDEIHSHVGRATSTAIFNRGPEDAASWLGLRGVRQILAEALGDTSFEDLRIPFAVTAVDFTSAEQIVLDRGRVVEAVLATISVPGVFPPFPYDGRQLIDGGILDPVPVDVARQMFPDLPVVAVVLSPALSDWHSQQPRLMNELPFLLKYMSTFRFSKALNMLLQSIDISGALLTELLLQCEPPDVIIRPEVRETGLLDFAAVDSVVAQGELAAERALPALEQAVSWPARLRRRFQPPRRAGLPFTTRRNP